VFALASSTTVPHAFVWTFTVTSVSVGMGLFMALLIGGGAVWRRRRRQAGGAVGVQATKELAAAGLDVPKTATRKRAPKPRQQTTAPAAPVGDAATEADAPAA